MNTKYHLIFATVAMLATQGPATAALDRVNSPDRRIAWPGIQPQASASTPGITEQPDDQDAEVMKKKKKKKKSSAS